MDLKLYLLGGLNRHRTQFDLTLTRPLSFGGNWYASSIEAKSPMFGQHKPVSGYNPGLHYRPWAWPNIARENALASVRKAIVHKIVTADGNELLLNALGFPHCKHRKLPPQAVDMLNPGGLYTTVRDWAEYIDNYSFDDIVSDCSIQDTFCSNAVNFLTTLIDCAIRPAQSVVLDRAYVLTMIPDLHSRFASLQARYEWLLDFSPIQEESLLLHRCRVRGDLSQWFSRPVYWKSMIDRVPTITSDLVFCEDISDFADISNCSGFLCAFDQTSFSSLRFCSPPAKWPDVIYNPITRLRN